MSETAIRLQPGDIAPDFTLDSADGASVTLSEVLKEHDRVVLYFYPAAMTPGCTTEACDFRDNLHAFDGAGLTVLGVSPDSPARLAKFVEQEGLTFPLLSDPDRAVLTSYGAFGEKKNYGRTVQGVIRSTFVISAGRTVEKAYYNVRATGHVDRIKRDLGL
ncbi:thioredoxin-dependent thiol peroxidase [Thermobifida halotolerans]|uniref:thioredoxin-dependent peroxiredoxin n=1 Tax=Thermobifida halotolerans TaxID=483545 RepID=A0A399G1M6_9ACTN|nr:thioredoxin-dependent thiol peroxidase [Thermobifida halotolerans]UOE18094.1 thioredoxin-dependent thiol peroxidase [Thermobifida halotolerans]